MTDREQQRLLVKSCGDVFMFHIIDWDIRVAYFEVKCHSSVFRHQSVVGADETFRLLCDMERSEVVSKQTLFEIILLLRQEASSIRSPGPYPCVKNIKPIDCDNLYEFLNTIANKLEGLAGLREEGGAK